MLCGCGCHFLRRMVCSGRYWRRQWRRWRLRWRLRWWQWKCQYIQRAHWRNDTALCVDRHEVCILTREHVTGRPQHPRMCVSHPPTPTPNPPCVRQICDVITSKPGLFPQTQYAPHGEGVQHRGNAWEGGAREGEGEARWWLARVICSGMGNDRNTSRPGQR